MAKIILPHVTDALTLVKPLDSACEYDARECFKLFLKRVKEVFEQGERTKKSQEKIKAYLNEYLDGHSILMLACQSLNDSDAIRDLIDLGADMTASGKTGTPLIHAVYGDNMTAVDVLLTKSAEKNVNLQTILSRCPDDIFDKHSHFTSYTPLRIACEKNRHKIAARLLKDASPDVVNMVNNHHWTALSYACMQKNPNITTLLLEFRADVELRHESGKTPLMFALMNPAETIATEECVQKLLESNAEPNAFDNDGRSPLYFAIMSGQYLALPAILEKEEVDVNDPKHAILTRSIIDPVAIHYGYADYCRRFMPELEEESPDSTFLEVSRKLWERWSTDPSVLVR